MNTKNLQSIDATKLPYLFATPHKLKRIIEQQQYKLRHQRTFDSLTRREIEIITDVAKGLSSSQIAEKLFISPHTVRQHRKNINKKLTSDSFSRLFQFALAFDLI